MSDQSQQSPPMFHITADARITDPKTGGMLPRFMGGMTLRGPEVNAEVGAAQDRWKADLEAKLLEFLRGSEFLAIMQREEEALDVLRQNLKEQQAAVDAIEARKSDALTARGAMQARFALENQLQLLLSAVAELNAKMGPHLATQNQAYRSFIAGAHEHLKSIFAEARASAQAAIQGEIQKLSALVEANLAALVEAQVQLFALERPTLLPSLRGLAPGLLPAMAAPPKLTILETQMLGEQIEWLRLGHEGPVTV